MEGILKYETEVGRYKTKVEIDTSSEHKDLLIRQSKNLVLELGIQMNLEEGILTINGIEFNPRMKAMLLDFLNQ